MLPIIVLLENESSTSQSLLPTLSAENYQVVPVNDVDQAITNAHAGAMDLLILTSDSCRNGDVQAICAAMESYLPVLVICDAISDALLDRFEGIDVDTFITRPVNKRLLLSKIASSLKNRQLYQQEIKQRKQLLEYWQLVDMEQEVAAKIFNNVLKRQLLETDVVKAILSPMALFNGDMVLVGKTPDNHLHLLLGDSTGHGLSASIAATPTSEIFYGMTQKGFAMVDIVREINSKLFKLLPTNMFLAATAATLYPEKTLTLITCGLPEHFLVNNLDGSCKTIHSKNIPLGIQDSVELEEQNFTVGSHHSLYLFTDGVFEAENRSGEAFGSERIVQAISENPAVGFETLRACLAEHSQGLQQQDDITIVKLICDVDMVSWQDSASQQTKRKVVPLNWKSSMQFDIDTLRVVNPVPVMVNALMEIQGLQDHRQAIFMIVSELFANALDHGLLELDTAIKNTPEGFVRFYQLKDERLESRQQGRIRFSFSHRPSGQGGRLIVKVTDSGAGFDWHKQAPQLVDNAVFGWRGIRLLESLCTQLTYHGKGNRVTAVFDWQ